MRNVILILILQILCALPVSAEEAVTEHMRWAVENGIVVGMQDGSLEPDGSVTRAQLAAMLERFFEPEAGETPGSYSDVDEDDWFYPYVASMSAAGIMIGDGDLWRPNDGVSREEAVTAVVRLAADDAVNDGVPAGFSDSEEISDWAEWYVNTAAELGIISAGEAEFRPKDTATRSELVLMLYNSRAYVYGNSLLPFIDEDGSAWTPIY